MDLATFEDFLKMANFFYATIGFHPYRTVKESKAKSLFTSFIFYSGVLNLNWQILSEIVYITLAIKNNENFLEATMTMACLGYIMVGNFKMLYIYWQKEALTKYITGLQNIFPQTRELQKEYNMSYYSKQCSRITTGFSLLYMTLIWTYNLFNIVRYLIYDIWLNMVEVGHLLPYTMHIPWDYSDNWTFYLLYALQNIAGYTSTAGQISSDLLLTACATQMVMHYDYISYKLSSYVTNPVIKEAKTETQVMHEKDMKYLQDMIKYHVNVLDLSEQLNNVFGVPLLLNFFVSSFIICFIGFQTTIGADVVTVIKLLLFLVSSISQVYLICHYGQLLLDASTNVAIAAYNQNWHTADVRYKKMLVLIIARAQKPAFLQATTFVLISRTTMTEIMQLSYKFFALLRTMYAE